MDFKTRLSQANSRLKSFPVSIVIIQQRLYLQGTFPAKATSVKDYPHQQRLSLGLPANPRGLKEAESQARSVGVELEQGRFTWDAHSRHQKPDTVAEWIERFRVDYFRKGGGEATWKGDYLQAFNKLPTHQPLTLALMVATAGDIEGKPKSRQRACMVYRRMAEFMGLDGSPLTALRGNYSPDEVDPRSLPTDIQIAQWRDAIRDPGWQWIFGIMSAYGLRPHECWHCDLLEFPKVIVEGDTKTGARFLWPLYPEWAERWQLNKRQLPKLPSIENGSPNTKIGTKVSRFFYQKKISKETPDGKHLTAYELRHCFARRLFEFGHSPEFGAKMMGHSPEIHSKVYRRWIDEGIYYAIYQKALAQSDRPQCP